MATTVSGLFPTNANARDAVLALLDSGIDHAEISLIANDPNSDQAHRSRYDEQRGQATGATLGAEIGAISGLLMGLAIVAVPGLGSLLVAGPLVGVLAGGGLGAAVGGVMGSANESGIPIEESSIFSEGIRNGGTVVMAHVRRDRVSDVLKIMADNGATDTNPVATRLDALRYSEHILRRENDDDATFAATPDMESDCDYNRIR